MWPGWVRAEINDDVEVMVCRQQALERLPRRAEADLEGQRAWCITWFNHFTATPGEAVEIEQTANDFLECELTPFHAAFRDNWRKRSHIRVGDPAHSAAFFNRGTASCTPGRLPANAPTHFTHPL